MAGSLLDEGIRGAAGALGIFLRRPDAMDYFVFTRGGFWRSFAALFFILPFSTISFLTQPDDPGGVAADPFVRAALSIISDIVVWAVAPVCIYLGTRVTGTAAHWRDLVIVVNWGAIVIAAVGAVAAPIWLLLSRS
ncbi:MAG: hypothetical protein KIT16_20220, partial [Rhodospirillaceae bacterium]|nr:hypothetical protein [Rhodospirillaceae bacterium]